MKRYHLTFTRCATAAEAFTLCNKLNAEATEYIRRNKPAVASVYGDEWIVFYYA